jgi:hypothetical protein
VLTRVSPRGRRRGYDIRRIAAVLGMAVNERVADLTQELDLHSQVLRPPLCHLVSGLRQLDLRLAQPIALDLLVALSVGDQRQAEVADTEQDDDEVVVELAHVD